MKEIPTRQRLSLFFSTERNLLTNNGKDKHPRYKTKGKPAKIEDFSDKYKDKPLMSCTRVKY